jgi:nucleoside diphosphate kinase
MKIINQREIKRRTDVEYIVHIKGDEEVFFGKKGEAGSASILEESLESGLLDAFFEIYDCWNGGQMFYEIDGYFYTVEKINNLTEDSVKESEFRQKLTEFITSMGLEVVSMEGDFRSQSKETLIAIERLRLNRWTKYKKYYAGENHYKLVIHQKHGFYKFVMVMSGNEDIYIATKYVAPATAEALDETIKCTFNNKSAQYESLTDVYNTLQSTFYGQLFYCGDKNAPQLTDGVLLNHIK